jgi:CBS domain containing-hemolysin-like protein
VIGAVAASPYSRLPVYRGSLDNIVGVLHTKDLVRWLVRGRGADVTLASLSRPISAVHESVTADRVLRHMRERRSHQALVVDEFGGTAGLVALEDLLEELVGEIADEYDEPERLVQRVDARTYRVAGKLPIDQLRALTGLKISDEDYDTVGGWVLDLFGRVPRKAERLEAPDFAVTVEKVERTRVVEVLVTLRRPAPGEAAA